jgi:hypothetical protein
MSDIVQRLREPVDPDHPNLWIVDKNRLEAAARIEALEAALREIAEWDDNGDQIAGEIARAALAPEQDK